MGNRSIAASQLLGAILILLGGLAFSSVAHAGGNTVKKDSIVNICYIQFYLNTMVPLTKENITHHSNCFEVSSSSDAATALVGLLDDAKPVLGSSDKFSDKFNNNTVRVMLSEPSSAEPYFIDQSGIVLRGKSTTRLSAWQKAAVQIILDYSYAKAKETGSRRKGVLQYRLRKKE